MARLHRDDRSELLAKRRELSLSRIGDDPDGVSRRVDAKREPGRQRSRRNPRQNRGPRMIEVLGSEPRDVHHHRRRRVRVCGALREKHVKSRSGRIERDRDRRVCGCPLGDKLRLGNRGVDCRLAARHHPGRNARSQETCTGEKHACSIWDSVHDDLQTSTVTIADTHTGRRVPGWRPRLLVERDSRSVPGGGDRPNRSGPRSGRIEPPRHISGYRPWKFSHSILRRAKPRARNPVSKAVIIGGGPHM
jgi:hypothetical protein